MGNKLKIVIVLLVSLLATIVYLDYNKPKPINWKQTYDLKDKIPYGLYVFEKESKKIFQNQKIEKVTTTLYEYLEPKYNYDSLVQNYSAKGTILSISQQNQIDDESAKELLIFVSKGNSAFLSSMDLSPVLVDSLKFELDYNDDLIDKKENKVWTTNKKLGNENFDLNLNSYTYFSKIDTLNTTVLGYIGTKKNKKINFIKVPYYDGYFYLHTQPEAFINYNLLKKNNFEYTQKILSYIPNEKVFWLTKTQNGEVVSNSPLRFIFSKPALYWAWMIFIFGMLVFLIFNAKRKQRIVPIQVPLTNTTIEFTKTIGNLYFQESEYQNIIDKKIIYFLEKVRNEYLIDTTVLDEKFVKRYQAKTSKSSIEIENVVRLINYQRKGYHQSVEEDLIELNKAIENII